MGVRCVYGGGYHGAYIAAFYCGSGHVYPVYFGFQGGKAVSVTRARSYLSSRCLFCLCWRCFYRVHNAAKWFLWQASAARRIPPLHFCTFILWLGATSCLPLAARSGHRRIGYMAAPERIQRIKTGRNTKFGRKKNKDGLLSSGRFTAGACLILILQKSTGVV